MTGYYRRFVQDFLRIAAPITCLTKKNMNIVWSKACENIFQLLKEKLTTTPVLTLLNGIDKFTDVSLDDEGVLWISGRLCVLNVDNLREKI